MESFLHWRERALKKETFPLNDSKAADEELFALERESVERGTFPLNEVKAADEELFALGNESL